MKHLKIFTLALLISGWFAVAEESKTNEPMSWDVLAKVEVIEKNNLLAPKFSQDVQNLDGTTVKLRGYMMPLDQAKKQKNFILSANPVASCYFCLPGGPETMVEVKATKSMKFSYNPITISGTLQLLADDPMGMYYRLVDATMEE